MKLNELNVQEMNESEIRIVEGGILGNPPPDFYRRLYYRLLLRRLSRFWY